MSDAGTITLEVSDGVAVLTIRRESRRNAMGWAMWQQLGEQADAIAARCAPDGDVRAVIVTGAGGHFCAGMDLKPDNPLIGRILPAVMTGDVDAARSVIVDLKAMTRKLKDLPVPTIAAIEGTAAGGGYEVALHCDMIVASRQARVGLPEVRIGMVPDVGGTTLLARRAGPARAALVVTSARMFGAEEAQRLGMLELLVDPGTALTEAYALAQDIALGGPRSVAGALDTARRVNDMDLDAAFAIETTAGATALTSGEPKEGVAAFMEKRAPKWDGA